MSTEPKIREEMCLLARSVFERGLTPGSSGNLSTRLPDGGFLMTPTNSSFGFLDPAALSRIDDDGEWKDGDKPTKEAFLHLAMYHGQPGLQAVTHLHSTWCVCLSCLTEIDPQNMIPPMTPYLHMRVGPVARVPYKKPGDDSLGPEIEKIAAKHSGIIIANHGPVVGGKSLRDSVFAMEELEEAAKLFMFTRQLPVNFLTPNDIAELDDISLRK